MPRDKAPPIGPLFLNKTDQIRPNSETLETELRPALERTRLGRMLAMAGNRHPDAGIFRPFFLHAQKRTLSPLANPADLEEFFQTGLSTGELESLGKLLCPFYSSILSGFSPLSIFATQMLITPDVNEEAQSDPGGNTLLCQLDQGSANNGDQQVLRFPHGGAHSVLEDHVRLRKQYKGTALEFLMSAIGSRMLINGIGISPDDPTLASFFDILKQLSNNNYRMNQWGKKELPKNLNHLLTELSAFSGDLSLLTRENPILLRLFGHFYSSPDSCVRKIQGGLELMRSTPNIMIAGPSSGGKTTLLRYIQSVSELVQNFGATSAEDIHHDTLQMRENKNEPQSKVHALVARTSCVEADRPMNVILSAYGIQAQSPDLIIIETPAPVSIQSLSGHGGLERALLLSYPGYATVKEIIESHLDPMDPNAPLIPTTIWGLVDSSQGLMHPVPDTPQSYNQLVEHFLGSLDLFLPEKYFVEDSRYSVNDPEVQDVISINFSMILKALPPSIREMLCLGISTRRPMQPIFVPANSEAPLSPSINHRNYGLLHLLAVLNNFGALTLGTNAYKLPILGSKVLMDNTIGINKSGNFDLKNIVDHLPEMISDPDLSSKMQQLKKFASFLADTTSTGKELSQSLYGLIICIHELFYFHNETQKKKRQEI